MDEDDVLDGQNGGGEEGTRGQQAPVTQPAPTGQQRGPVDDIALERTRCSEIQAIGAQFGLARQAGEAVANGVSLDEFRKTVLAHVRANGNKPAGTDMNLDLSAKERQQYSLLNAIRANISGNWKKAGFEREISVALAEKMGRDARGFMVNYEILGGLGSRGQDTKTEAKGGALVANELHSDKFIELLRSNSVAAQLGVRFVTGLVGNVDIPKMLSGSSFYWIDEGEDGTESDAQFGIVQMSPKTIAGAVPITRRLMAQSTPDIDVLIRDDMLAGLGLGIDKAIFVGTGTGSEPLGIVNQTGVNAIDLNTLGLSHAALVAFETAIEEADALTGQLQYLVRPSTKGTLKTTPINANSERYLWNGNELNGYAAMCAKWLLSNAILAGDFRQAMFGTWGALDLMVDKTSKAASGGTVLRVFQDGDVAVRHAKAFAYGRKTT